MEGVPPFLTSRERPFDPKILRRPDGVPRENGDGESCVDERQGAVGLVAAIDLGSTSVSGGVSQSRAITCHVPSWGDGDVDGGGHKFDPGLARG